jgi:hypothetical protein
MVYLIGSLRNPKIPDIANQLQRAGHEIFSDWFSAGETADDSWKAYEQARGRNYIQALQGKAATNVFEFDKRNLEAATMAVLVMSAGKSAFLELGWHLGKGKPGFILLEQGSDRWDVMFKFATAVVDNIDDLLTAMRREQMRHEPGAVISWNYVNGQEPPRFKVSAE